ncbi:MAG TPA: hypothetical protein GXX19_09485 [Syntrophomonadaceae bacterium]|nr:hypothetical protein [Syntrophomonadaceae bacterium]
MPDDDHLIEMLRALIREELEPVCRQLRQAVERLDALEEGQKAIENALARLQKELCDVKIGVSAVRRTTREWNRA